MGAQRERRHEAGGTQRSETAHYTPPSVARHLVRESLGRWLWRGAAPNETSGSEGASLSDVRWRDTEELEALRILDPACGDGAFLLAARDTLFEYLTARARAHGTRPPRRAWLQRLACRILHGVDVDRSALATARARLAAGPPGARQDRRDGHPVLRRGNALLTPAHLAAIGVGAAECRRLAAWDPASRRGFAAVLARGGFDFVFGNPPYAALRDLDPVARAACAGAYSLGSGGQRDLFALFYERTVGEWLRPGGIHVFLVPDALLARDDHGAVRALVTSQLAVERVVITGAVFEHLGDSAASERGGRPRNATRRVAVSTVGIIGVKRPAPASRTVVIERWGGGRVRSSTVMPTDLVLAPGGDPWPVTAPRRWFGARGLRAQLEASGLRLRDVLRQGTAGLTRGEELGKAHLERFDPAQRAARLCTPILAGEDVRRHVVAPPGHQVPFAWLSKRETVSAAPRVLLVKTGAGIVAAPSREPIAALQSVYVLHLSDAVRDALCEASLCAVLCSAWLGAYAWFRWTSTKALHPQLTIGNVASLPLPSLEALRPARHELAQATTRLATLLAPGDASAAALSLDPIVDPRRAAIEEELDEVVARLFGLRLASYRALLENALAVLPPSQRSAWISATPPSPMAT